jgi:hypothetical protein
LVPEPLQSNGLLKEMSISLRKAPLASQPASQPALELLGRTVWLAGKRGASGYWEGLPGWLADLLAGKRGGRLATGRDCLAGWLTGWLAGKRGGRLATGRDCLAAWLAR